MTDDIRNLLARAHAAWRAQRFQDTECQRELEQHHHWSKA